MIKKNLAHLGFGLLVLKDLRNTGTVNKKWKKTRTYFRLRSEVVVYDFLGKKVQLHWRRDNTVVLPKAYPCQKFIHITLKPL